MPPHGTALNVADLFRFVTVNNDQSDYLASWRGGSAIVVLVGHACDIFLADPHPIWGVLATGAVLVFFGLSGFFIHKALAKSMASGGVWSFVAGRVNRIVPPFALSLIVVVFLWAIAPAAFLSGDRSFVTPTARSGFSLDGLMISAAFLNGFVGPTLSANGPLWSLSFEVWYYIAALAVGVAILRRSWWPILVVGPMIVALTVLNLRFAILGLIWLLGFALSAMHAVGRVPRVRELPAALVAGAAVALAAFHDFPGAQLLSNLAVGLWFVIHMSRVLYGNVPWISRRLVQSSHFAYALYVMHFPLLLFIYGVTGERSWVAVPAALAVLVLMALMGRRIEETRLLRRR